MLEFLNLECELVQVSGHNGPAYIQPYIIRTSSDLPAAPAVAVRSGSRGGGGDRSTLAFKKHREAPEINDVATADLRPNVLRARELAARAVTSRPVVTACGRVSVSAHELPTFGTEVK